MGKSTGSYIETSLTDHATDLKDIVVGQVKQLLNEQSAADSVISKKIALQKAIFDTLRGSRDFADLKKAITEQTLQKIASLPATQKSAIPDPEAYANMKVQQQLEVLKSPSYFSFLDYNPTDDLSKLSIPVLAIYGENDMQVPFSTNKSVAKKALRKSQSNYEIKVFEDANHLFQKSETGSVSEYAKLGTDCHSTLYEESYAARSLIFLRANASCYT